MASYRKAKPNWRALDLCPLRIRRTAPSSSEKWHKVQRRPLARGSALISTETCPKGFYALLHSAQCTQHFKTGTARTLYLNHLFEADESIADSVHLNLFLFLVLSIVSNCPQTNANDRAGRSHSAAFFRFAPLHWCSSTICSRTNFFLKICNQDNFRIFFASHQNDRINNPPGTNMMSWTVRSMGNPICF